MTAFGLGWFAQPLFYPCSLFAVVRTISACCFHHSWIISTQQDKQQVVFFSSKKDSVVIEQAMEIRHLHDGKFLCKQ